MIGGAGFIGSHTVDALLDLGLDVVVLDSLNERIHRGKKPNYSNPKAEFIIGDIRDKSLLTRCLERVNYVYNFAAYQDYLTDFSEFFSINSVASSLIYEVIVEKKLKIEKVIIASSQFVQGEGRYSDSNGNFFYPRSRLDKDLKKGIWDFYNDDNEKLDWSWTSEEYSQPTNSYSMSKFSQEMIGINLGRQYDIPTVVLRYSIVQGSRQSFFNTYSGACRIFCLHYENNISPVIFEDGKMCRDFVNINDKGIRPYKYLNNCNAIIFSNDKDCLHVDTSSRRYLVIHCKTTTKEVEKMAEAGEFDPLWKMLDEHPGYLLNYFLNEVEIEDEEVYQKRAPKTPELLEMIEDSKHDIIGDLDEAFAEKSPPFDSENFRGFISRRMLVNFIKAKDGWNTPHPPKKLITDWLRDKGIPWNDGKKSRQMVMSNGARPRVFLLENKREILKDLTEGELGELASRKNPDHYWEDCKLDYLMEKKEQYKDGEGKWHEHKPSLSTEYMVLRACYYLKFMSPEILEKLIIVQQKLLPQRRLIQEKNTKREYHGAPTDRWIKTTDWVNFNKEYEPLQNKAHKIIDEMIKAEEKAREETKEEDPF